MVEPNPYSWSVTIVRLRSTKEVMKQTTEVGGNQTPEACSLLSGVSTCQAHASPIPTRYYVYVRPYGIKRHFFKVLRRFCFWHSVSTRKICRQLQGYSKVWLILPPLGHILSVGGISIGNGIATPARQQQAQAGDSPGVGGFQMVARCVIVGVALVGQQWQVVAVGRESGRSSGGPAVALSGRQRRNTCTAALLGQEGGGGHAAVLVRQQQVLSGREG
jgi:hypothetical protein